MRSSQYRQASFEKSLRKKHQDLLCTQDIWIMYILYRHDAKYICYKARHPSTVMILSFRTDRSEQIVQAQRSIWSWSTLFAIPSATFERIILWYSHLVQHLRWLQQMFWVSECFGFLRKSHREQGWGLQLILKVRRSLILFKDAHISRTLWGVKIIRVFPPWNCRNFSVQDGYI